MDNWKIKNRWYCNVCNVDIRKCGPHWDCQGPRHHLKVLQEEVDALDDMGKTMGLYVDPETGRFVRKGPISTGKTKRIKKRKPLNTPAVLGKE